MYLPLVKIHLAREHFEDSERSCNKETCLQTKHFPNLFDHETCAPQILHPAGYICGCRRHPKVFMTWFPSASKSLLLIPLPQASHWALAMSFPVSSCPHLVAFVQAVPAGPFPLDPCSGFFPFCVPQPDTLAAHSPLPLATYRGGL